MKLACKPQNFFTIWPIYLILFPIVFFSFNWAIDLKTKPSDDKVLDLFIALNSINKSFNDTVKENLKNYDVKEINTTLLSPTFGDFNRLYKSIQESVDFYIMPKSILDKSFEEYFLYYSPITKDNIKSNLGDDIAVYSYNNYDYGVKIYDHISKTGFGVNTLEFSKGELDDDYYMFLNVKSIFKETSKNNIATFYDVIKSLG